MDEEGTVVYFQTSPALQDHETSELAFTEHEETENTTDDDSHPTALQNDVCRKCYLYFASMLSPDLSCRGEEFSHSIATAIRDSPLLTEEDYRLLYFALLKPHPQKQNISGARHHLFPSISVVSAVVVGLLAVCCTTSQCALMMTAGLVLAAVLAATLMLFARPVLTLLVRKRHERELLMARQAVEGYCSETESMLSLLTHCLKTIQEAEIITRAYNRPLGWKAVGVAEGSTVHVYGSFSLRQTLFCVCQAMINRLRSATTPLCQRCPLSCEVDDGVAGYLAHSPLDSLHSYITTDLGTLSKEDVASHKCLSLESLKDGASLLAVQSSELLRHLCLALVSPSPPPPPHGGGGSGDTAHTTVARALCDVLEPMREAVSQDRLRLQWSYDLHKNHLFSDPPSRPTVPETHGIAVSSTVGSVEGLTGEVHSMDVKTQAALQRMRDLGEQLSTVSDDEVITAISKYGEQLMVVQRLIDSVSDHIEDSLTITHEFQHPNHAHRDAEGKCETEGEAVEESAEQTFKLPLDPCEEDGSCSSEDEMVFEGYVPALRDGEEDGVGGSPSHSLSCV